MKSYIKQINEISLLKKYVILGLFFHIISAYYSLGFYKDDEHFQILEPLGYLLGLNDILIHFLNSTDAGQPWEGQYWEWELGMRPWLQPYIYYYLVLLMKFIGINNSFTWVFLIKLLSSIFGFLSILYMFITIRKYFYKKDNHFNYLIFFSFWFYPYLHSRTSSENFGITIFIFAFCFLFKEIINKKEKYNIIPILFFGILLGLSLVVRLNLIFSIAPIFLWVLIFRFNFKKISIIMFGVCISLLIGLIIDYIHYDKFNLTYWNYFYNNIILGRMIAFGQHPWWYYLPTMAIQLAPVVSIFFVISLFVFWFKKPKNIFTWLTLATLIIVSFFSHKEIRYIFPIYIFTPFFISYFFENFNKIKFNKLYKILIIFSNFLFLSLTLITPANGKIAAYNYLFKQNIKTNNIFYSDENPYLINDMEPLFYTSFLPKIFELKKENFIKINEVNNSWIITNNYENYKKIMQNKNCLKKYNAYPEKIINLNKNWRKQRFNWYIVNCKY